MDGQFTLKVCSPGSRPRQILADRRGLSWDQTCDLLKNVGDHLVIVLVYDESGKCILRAQPKGMFGPLVAEVQDVAPNHSLTPDGP